MRGAHAGERRRYLILACLWMAFAVYGSLVPLHYRAVSLNIAIERFRHLPPLWTGIGTRADWVANILLFIPLTFLWMGALTSGRGRGARIAVTLAVLPAACLASIAIEFAQIWFPGRTVSKNDIFAETLGGVIGVAAWWIVGAHLTNWLGSGRSDRRSRSALQWVLEAYVIVFVFFELIPFDLTISVTDLARKITSGAVVLVPFSYHYIDPVTALSQFLGDTVTFVPIGAWIAVARPLALRWRHSFVMGVVTTGLVATALEFAQFTTDIVLGALGGGVGAWLIGRVHQRAVAETVTSSDRSVGPVVAAVGILLAYSAFLMVGFWYPFDWTRDHAVLRARAHLFFRVPFAVLYTGTEFNALNQVAIRMLAFAPLGGIVAYLATLPQRAWASHSLAIVGWLYAVGLAAGIEVMQIALPSKIADATEVPICIGGVAVGYAIVRRVLRTSLGPAAAGEASPDGP
jgi:glycopeptide antibiotics resistance protein